MKASNWPLLKEKAWTDCLQFSLPASFSVFWLRAMIVFSVYFSFYDRVEFSVFFSLFNYSHLPHGYKKTQQFLSPSCFFLPFFPPEMQTQLLQWKEGQNWMLRFQLCLSDLFFSFFFFLLTREKVSEKVCCYIWICRHCEGTICHISPTLSDKIYIQRMREAEGRGRKDVGGCRGWNKCCQASSGLSVLSVTPLQAFALQGRGWQDGRLWQSRKINLKTAIL